MKKLFVLLTALALVLGSYSCSKPEEPKEQEKPGVSADPSQSPSEEPSENPSDEPSTDPEKLTIEHIYPIGPAFEWAWDKDSAEEMASEDGIFTWEGEMKEHQDFKFLLQRDWWPGLVHDKTADDPYAIIVGTDDSMDNKFQVQVHGIYLLTINAKDSDAITLDVELIEELGEQKLEVTELYLLGDATTWGWSLDDMEAFTSLGNGLFTWTGQLSAGKELRFPLQKQSNKWWPCLVKGAEEGTLAVGYGDGDKNNIDVPADGEYTIDVDTEAMTYTMTSVQKFPVEVKPLFGFQPIDGDTRGMVVDANMSLAVSGDYLILSNCKDISKMPVYDRFSGEFLGDNIVNTSTITYGGEEGLAEDQKFWAIASDDEGHMAAVTFVDSRESGAVTTNTTVRGWTWPNGVEAAPVSKWWAGFWHYGTGQAHAFKTMKIAGDLTGDAVVGTAASSGVAIFDTFTSGNCDNNWLKKQLPESPWWGASVIPTTGSAKTAEDIDYMYVDGKHPQYVGTAGTKFDLGEYWYMGGGTYQRSAVAGDFLSYRGRNILAVLNAWYAGQQDGFGNNKMYFQLVVSDIGAAPTASSLTDGLLFASRFSPNENGLAGMGYGANGMFSPFCYTDGGTVLGPNALAANIDRIADVVIATDGPKIEVYALVMNLGVVGYEITFHE